MSRTPYPLFLRERVRVRVLAPHHALTPALSQREREQQKGGRP